MKLAASVVAEEIAGTTVLLRILIGNEEIEHVHDLRAGFSHRLRRHDEDEVVATDVSDEALLSTQPLHDVVQDLREYSNDAIAVVVRVPVVELLEVVEVGIAHRKASAR